MFPPCTRKSPILTVVICTLQKQVLRKMSLWYMVHANTLYLAILHLFTALCRVPQPIFSKIQLLFVTYIGICLYNKDFEHNETDITNDH